MKYLALFFLILPALSFGQQCVDSDGDGWGWDGKASCRVTTTQTAPQVTPQGGSCDYSNADQSGGWGWDNVNKVSCPPAGQAQAQPQPQPELDGIAGAIVGTWQCDEELFFDGQWHVEKGSETYNGVTVDMFTQRVTFNSDGSHFAETSLDRNSRQYQTQDNSAWSVTGFRLSINRQTFSQIGFENRNGRDVFYMYSTVTHRKACMR